MALAPVQAQWKYVCHTGPIIFVKPSKAVVPQTPAPAKQAKQANSDAPMGRPTAKGKGKGKEKEKAVNLAEGDQYNPPCKRCAGVIYQ
ncbi:hypothetical protein BDR03DRAFT_1009593 [Suillus americanus]|nr:hypothetical protein BDR03DRAFT_1009593 [Suillus americanus]